MGIRVVREREETSEKVGDRARLRIGISRDIHGVSVRDALLTGEWEETLKTYFAITLSDQYPHVEISHCGLHSSTDWKK